jgi:hypothetical protein
MNVNSPVLGVPKLYYDSVRDMVPENVDSTREMSLNNVNDSLITGI